MIIDDEKRAKALAHVWNRQSNIYFDITREIIWVNDNGISEIKYVEIKTHKCSDFENLESFNFCTETNEKVEEINRELDQNV